MEHREFVCHETVTRCHAIFHDFRDNAMRLYEIKLKSENSCHDITHNCYDENGSRLKTISVSIFFFVLKLRTNIALGGLTP